MKKLFVDLTSPEALFAERRRKVTVPWSWSLQNSTSELSCGLLVPGTGAGTKQIPKLKLGASTGCYEGELLTDDPYGFVFFWSRCVKDTHVCFFYN